MNTPTSGKSDPVSVRVLDRDYTVGVTDADALHDELKARGAIVRHPPTDYSWAREMQIADPDGNVLRLGSDPRVGAEPGEWLDMHGIRWAQDSFGIWQRAD